MNTQRLPVQPPSPLSPRAHHPLRASSPRWHRHPVALAAWLVVAAAGVLQPQAVLAQGAGGVLAPTTLPVLRGLVAGQAVLSAPLPGATQPRLVIDQASQRAILDWRSFNIGADAEVLFRHAQGSGASTLNRIFDANPSVIQGRLRSEGPAGADGKVAPGGQVILINQNGILFDRGAQVDTQALLASTHALLQTPAEFCGKDLGSCNAGRPLSAGGLLTPILGGGYDDAGNPLPARPDGRRPGTIGIGSFGPANAAAPRLQAGAGGSIVLAASRVDHDAGLVTAPDGQVVLAAGARVFLAVNDNTSDLTLRGLRVEVEAHRDGAGLNLTNLIRNAGTVSAERGNVTLAALAINQEGRVSAATAVQLNGSVFLQARDRPAAVGAQSGTLRLAAGSVTEVMPDLADRSTLPESQAYDAYRGQIRAHAGRIESQGTLRAPGGRIGLEASSTTDPGAARLYLGETSLTTVAGAWTDVDPAKNIVTLKLTSNELKNAPDQKGGLLLGATVTVDLRESASFLALDGYRGTVARTVAEKAAVGGELSLSSTGDLIQRAGAHIDASGGGYRYAEHRAATSQLLGDDGRVYGIGTAPQQRQFVAQLDRVEQADTRWNQSRTVVNTALASGSVRAASVEGLQAGTVRIGSGRGLVLDGGLAGGVTIGERQFARAPTAGTLLVGTGLETLKLDATRSLTSIFNDESQRIAEVRLVQSARDTLGAGFTADSALSPAQRERLLLAADQVFGASRVEGQVRVEQAFGQVQINADGRIALPADVALRAPGGRELALSAPVIDLAGDLHLPGGQVSLTLRPIDVAKAIDPAVAARTERLVVQGSSTLSLAGDWLNLSALGGASVGELRPTARVGSSGALGSALDGGRLTVRLLEQGFQTRLERGALIDVSGGALLDAARRISGGRGGSVSLSTGSVNAESPDWMQAELRGHALAGGSSLTLNVGRAVLGNGRAARLLPADTTAVDPAALGAAGFASINVQAPLGIAVADGEQIELRTANRLIDPQAVALLPSGASLHTVASSTLLLPHRRSGAGLTLGAALGTVKIGRGARIGTDPGGTLNFSAGLGLRIDGELSAPAGRVALTLDGLRDQSVEPLVLGPGSRVLVGAQYVATPNDSGLRLGTVLSAGSVSLEARRAAVHMDASARIDLSGLTQDIDLPGSDALTATRSQTLAGHAGTLVVKAQNGLRLDGSLAAQGPGTAAGGSLAVELTRPDAQASLPPPQRLVLTADGVDRPAGGLPTVPASAATTSVLDARRLGAAGFERLRLLSEDSIEFQGELALGFSRGLRLDAPVLTLAPNARVSLSGSSVALGQSLGIRRQDQLDGQIVWTRADGLPQPVRTPTPGNGLLSIDAGTFDVYGSSIVQGTGLTRITSQADTRLIGREVDFNAANGSDPGLIYQYGSLDLAGSVELRAAQVYPATRTRFDLRTHGLDSYLLLGHSGGVRGAVHSVGGHLTLSAPRLVQGGAVLAPHGELALRASERLDLAAGSTTSVSGLGQTVLFGDRLDGQNWRYVDGNATNNVNAWKLLDSAYAGGKRLDLRAPITEVAPGATVDLRGGGELLAADFVPGRGGDRDIALAADTFAILPQALLSSVPYDAHQQTVLARDAGSDFRLGTPRDELLYDSLHIGPGSPVPAGDYVLLPTRYALLPGAMLVQLQTGSAWRNLQPGAVAALPNGEPVTAAWRSARGTDLRESQSVGVVVLPGAALSRYSDYTLGTSRLWADRAALAQKALPAMTWDAGSLALFDARRIELAGDFLVEATKLGPYSGRQAQVDISGPRIAVVDRVAATPPSDGTLEISTATLARVKASVLVGGTRSRQADGVLLTPLADRVSVATTAQNPLELPELLLAARDSLDIAAGSVLRAVAGADASADPNDGRLRTPASGALLRVSGLAQADVQRDVGPVTGGDITIGRGAVLHADRSLLLDAARSAQVEGSLLAGAAGGAGGSVSLSAARVALGDAAATGYQGLVLGRDTLDSYAGLDALSIQARTQLDLFGSVNLGGSALKRLDLSTPRLVAQAVEGKANAAIQADSVTWSSISPAEAPAATASPGVGSLVLRAQHLQLGAGDKLTQGIASLQLQASSLIEGDGQGSLRVGGSLELVTPVLRMRGGADQRLIAEDGTRSDDGRFGAIRVLAPAPAAAGTAAADATLADAVAPGGRLSLQGASLRVDTTVQARSGRIALQAMNPGESAIDLGPTARLDVRGLARDFNGSVAAVAGGEVHLASQGSVLMQAGSRIDASADAAGGDAGRVAVQAADLRLLGELSAAAGAGARGGEAWFDLGRLENFSTFNALLERGGFSGERGLRLRSGNLLVGSEDRVGARRVVLSADQGSIQVDGIVGQSTAAGGARIELYAANDLSLGAGARVLANAEALGGRGGEVRLSSRGGSLRMDAQAVVDVRAGEAGEAGAVIFGVARNSAGELAATQLQGQLLRHRQGPAAAGATAADTAATVRLEATRILRGDAVPGTLDAAAIAGLAQDNQAFLAASAARGDDARLASLRDEQGPLRDGLVAGALELQASGSLVLGANWDLTQDAWRAGNRNGTLTIRAAGGLTLNQTLGGPNAPNLAPTTANAAANSNIQTANHAILAGETWNLRLAAGADLLAADPMATLSPSAAGGVGNLVLATAAAGLRTGTGRIDLAAAQDLRLQDPASAIYTAGRVGAADTAVNGNQRWAVDGGGISVRVGGAIAGPAASNDLWVTDWLRRLRQTEPQFRAGGFLTDWWSFRPRFQQGLATLAGGDMELRAGGAVSDLMLALPTAGRTLIEGESRSVEVTGGGNLSLRAGGSVEGASFVVGRGEAWVEAGGDIGAVQPVQAYLMGASSGVLPERATLTLNAGGSVSLQSVDNPTVMGLNSGVGAVGPSFHPTTASLSAPTTRTASFFTYGLNSGVALVAEGGDAGVIGGLAPSTAWRSINTLVQNNLVSGASAFPASLALISLGGDVRGPASMRPESPPRIVSFPSPSASVVALAAGSLLDVSLEASDRAVAALITPRLNVAKASDAAIGANFNAPGRYLSVDDALTPSLTSTARVDKREGGLALGLVAQTGSAKDLRFDFQAAGGDILFTRSTQLVLPGRSRVRAAHNVLNPPLLLQNLRADDLSEVRADVGRISTVDFGSVAIAGPGRLLLQAGADIDLGRSPVNVASALYGNVLAVGNAGNPQLSSAASARLTLLAGVPGNVDLARLEVVYPRLKALNDLDSRIKSLYAQLDLEGEAGRAAVLGANSVAALAARNPVYSRFAALDAQAPEALAAYQRVLREQRLPAPGSRDAQQAERVLGLLARQDDVTAILSQPSLGAWLASQGDGQGGAVVGGERIDAATVADWTALGSRFPTLYRGASTRRANGAQLTSTVPLVFDALLEGVVSAFVPEPKRASGSLYGFRTSVQTLGGSDIDLWAPSGSVLAGLTTTGDTATGVLTNQGGAIRSVVQGDFAINTGKVLTALGGDILIYSAAGSIDAGRGPKTSLSTPPPRREPVLDLNGNIVGFKVVIAASATGSGIQTLTSDPDGLGPATMPPAGDIALFAPAGSIDAGEAGIRSGGNISINAQVVRNASEISASGSSQGVPQVPTGSLASSLAASGSGSNPAAQSEERAARAAEQAARQAGAAQRTARPTILSVEVLGFGERACREDDSNCLGR